MQVRDHAVVSRRSRPLLRAVTFAGIAVPVSLIAHVSASGASPDDATVVLALAVTTVGYRVLLARRERSWPALALALCTAQALAHALFMSGASPTPGMQGMQGMDRTSSHPSVTAMVAAHLVAALVLAWFLRQGERALWTAARRSVHAVVRLPQLIAAALALLSWLLVVPCSQLAEAGRRPRWAAGAHARRYRATGGRYWRGPPASTLV